MEQNSRTVVSLSASAATAATTSRWNSDSDYTSPLGDIIRTSQPRRPPAQQRASHHRRLLHRHTETTQPPSTQTHRNDTTTFYTDTQKQHNRLLHRHTETTQLSVTSGNNIMRHVSLTVVCPDTLLPGLAWHISPIADIFVWKYRIFSIFLIFTDAF